MKSNPSLMPCVTSGQLARMVGVSIDALHTLVATGVIEPTRTPTGRVLYRPVDIVAAQEHFARCRRS